MGSSKKSRGEKKKSKEKGSTKIEKKSSKKSKKPKTKISNGKVNEPEILIIPSSSNDSQEQEDNQEEEEVKSRSQFTNQHTKSSKSKKSKKREKEDDDGEEEEKEEGKVGRFPTRRIWRIIKSEDSGSMISNDAVFLVNKASEKFLEQFCEDAYACSVKDRKKSLSYKHLSSVVCKQRRYDFLSDFVPEKLKAKDALAERKSAETGAR